MTARRERLILAAGLVWALVFCAGPIFNPDLGWHLAAGRQMVLTRAVPRADFLSWTMAGKPWIDFEWLTQLFLYGLERAGGLAALWAFKSAAFAGLSLMLIVLLRQWKIPDAWAGLALPPFALALFPMSDIRPEVFSLLLFMVQFYVLERRRLGRWRAGKLPTLAGHAAAYALWANLHAGFATGLVLCAVYGTAEALRERRGPDAGSPLAWAAAGLLGGCVNPYGPGLYAIYPEHWRQREILRQLVIEWERPNFSNTYMAGYWVLAAFSFAGVLAAIAQGAALPLEHLLAFGVFALFASGAFRTTAYAALLTFPLGLLAWREVRAPAWWPRARPAAIALGVAALAWRTSVVVAEQRYRHPLAVLESYGPAGACDLLVREKAVLGGLRLYNPWNWGGYIDRYLYPDYKASMDGRYLFTSVLGELESVQTQPPGWRRYLDEHGIDLVLLPNDGRMIRPGMIATWRPFIAYAMPRSEWALIYWDSESVLLVRRSKVPAAWLKPREYRLLRPHDTRYLSLLLTAGNIRLEDAQAEIRRYESEIGDALEVLQLKVWLGEVRKGLNQKPAAQPRIPLRG